MWKFAILLSAIACEIEFLENCVGSGVRKYTCLVESKCGKGWLRAQAGGLGVGVLGVDVDEEDFENVGRIVGCYMWEYKNCFLNEELEALRCLVGVGCMDIAEMVSLKVEEEKEFETVVTEVEGGVLIDDGREEVEEQVIVGEIEDEENGEEEHNGEKVGEDEGEEEEKVNVREIEDEDNVEEEHNGEKVGEDEGEEEKGNAGYEDHEEEEGSEINVGHDTFDEESLFSTEVIESDDMHDRDDNNSSAESGNVEELIEKFEHGMKELEDKDEDFFNMTEKELLAEFQELYLEWHLATEKKKAENQVEDKEGQYIEPNDSDQNVSGYNHSVIDDSLNQENAIGDSNPENKLIKYLTDNETFYEDSSKGAPDTHLQEIGSQLEVFNEFIEGLTQKNTSNTETGEEMSHQSIYDADSLSSDITAVSENVQGDSQAEDFIAEGNESTENNENPVEFFPEKQEFNAESEIDSSSSQVDSSDAITESSQDDKTQNHSLVKEILEEGTENNSNAHDEPEANSKLDDSKKYSETVEEITDDRQPDVAIKESNIFIEATNFTQASPENKPISENESTAPTNEISQEESTSFTVNQEISVELDSPNLSNSEISIENHNASNVTFNENITESDIPISTSDNPQETRAASSSRNSGFLSDDKSSALAKSSIESQSQALSSDSNNSTASKFSSKEPLNAKQCDENCKKMCEKLAHEPNCYSDCTASFCAFTTDSSSVYTPVIITGIILFLIVSIIYLFMQNKSMRTAFEQSDYMMAQYTSIN